MNKPFLSIIIPVWNEVENVISLHSEIADAIKKMKKPCEIIFIDDGSSDGTLRNLLEIRKKDSNVKIIEFTKHFGKSDAIDAGFAEAQGKYVITMDGDLQDDPKEIPRFVEEIERGVDVVVGWKHARKDTLGKRFFSRIFNSITNSLTGVNLHDSDCGFKIFRNEVVKSLRVYGELHRYLPALAKGKGFAIAEMKINHRPRVHGKSKYRWTRLFKGSLDLLSVKFLTTYGKSPMYVLGSIGLVFFIVGLITNMLIFYEKVLLHRLISEPLLIIGILLMVLGVQFASIGFLGEMIASIEEKRHYVIRRVV